MKILFRLNAGNQNGFGHLTRCIALAEELRKNNIKFHLFIKSDNSHSVSDFLLQEGISAKQYSFFSAKISKKADYEQLIELYKQGFSFLVLDHYDHDKEYCQKLNDADIKWAQFDYAAKTDILADIVINTNIGADKSMYAGVVTPKTKLCVGYNYAILRDNILEKKADSIPNHILISMGGGKSNTIKLLECIIKQETKFVFHIITRNNAVTEKISAYTNVKVYENISNIGDVYRKVQVAIVAGGVTTFELAYLNIPMIMIPIANNQIQNTIAWTRHKYAKSFNPVQEFITEVKKAGLQPIVNSVIHLFQRRKILIDGLGKQRIIKTIIEKV